MPTHFWQVFLPGKFHGHRNLVGIVHGVAKNWTQLSTHGDVSNIAWDILIYCLSMIQNQLGVLCFLGKLVQVPLT